MLPVNNIRFKESQGRRRIQAGKGDTGSKQVFHARPASAGETDITESPSIEELDFEGDAADAVNLTLQVGMRGWEVSQGWQGQWTPLAGWARGLCTLLQSTPGAKP